jgi:hypothetical protein
MLADIPWMTVKVPTFVRANELMSCNFGHAGGGKRPVPRAQLCRLRETSQCRVTMRYGKLGDLEVVGYQASFVVLVAPPSRAAWGVWIRRKTPRMYA